MRVRGHRVLDAARRDVGTRADGVVVKGVLHEQLGLPVLLLVVAGQDLQIGCQLLDAETQISIFMAQHLVGPDQLLELHR